MNLNTKKRSGLGKGLNALLEDATKEVHEENKNIESTVLKFQEIPLNQIERNSGQPRTDFDEDKLEELAESMRVHGVIQPITVRQVGRFRYQIISGERRSRAALKAGLEKMPAYIRLADDTQTLEMALIENIQREDLNAIEVATTYQRLIEECSLRQEDLGNRVGKKRSTVTNYLRLLKLPTEVQIALKAKLISMGHARALLPIDNIELQKTLLEDILEQDMSVRQIEKLVKEVLDNKGQMPTQAVEKEPAGTKEREKPNYDKMLWEEKLSNAYNRKIQIKLKSDGKGEMVLPFKNEEDLHAILQLAHKK